MNLRCDILQLMKTLYFVFEGCFYLHLILGAFDCTVCLSVFIEQSV